jgi:hypothetical protein
MERLDIAILSFGHVTPFGRSAKNAISVRMTRPQLALAASVWKPE